MDLSGVTRMSRRGRLRLWWALGGRRSLLGELRELARQILLDTLLAPLILCLTSPFLFWPLSPFPSLCLLHPVFFTCCTLCLASVHTSCFLITFLCSFSCLHTVL